MSVLEIQTCESPLCVTLRQSRSGLNVDPILGAFFYVNQELSFEEAEVLCGSLLPGSHMATPAEIAILQQYFILPSGELCTTLFWTVIQAGSSEIPVIAVAPNPGGEVKIVSTYYCLGDCVARLLCVQD